MPSLFFLLCLGNREVREQFKFFAFHQKAGLGQHGLTYCGLGCLRKVGINWLRLIKIRLAIQN